jgi:hypothetical protein
VKQQIGVPPPQRGIDKAAGNPSQPIQIELFDQGAGQHCPQLRCRIRRLAKDSTKHRVVGTRLTRHGVNVQAGTDT